MTCKTLLPYSTASVCLVHSYTEFIKCFHFSSPVFIHFTLKCSNSFFHDTQLVSQYSTFPSFSNVSAYSFAYIFPIHFTIIAFVYVSTAHFNVISLHPSYPNFFYKGKSFILLYFMLSNSTFYVK